MTIEYFATRIAKHISVQATYPDGKTEIIAILPRDALSGLVTRNNQLIHIAFDSMGTRNRETVLVDKQEHDADQILTAIDSCLRLEYLMERRFSRTPLFRAIIAGVVLFIMATIAFSLFSFADRIFWNDTTAEAVQTAGEPRLPPSHLNNTVPLKESIPLPVTPKKDVQVPEKTLTSKNPEAAAARHNLATVLKRNADRGMFTVNLSSGHERTLYAFLDPRCPNCRALEPALKRLSADFNVVVYPVSVIGGDKSASHMAPLLCEKDPQKRAEGWHHLYSADAGMMVPGSTEALPDETCLKAARAAIDVNNLAFRQFGFAGTPWVLSDTGWHLPTGLLQESGTVKLFLKTTDSESDHE
ncbi:DsbC family protein [Salmonella enterica subsp. enterica serovar Enteritidis]|nr:DsbC family protein [Salmonella enterica subsp. enterica serovar Enteritidis]EGT9239844.1 DsbC family protein [Salmonella enterica]